MNNAAIVETARKVMMRILEDTAFIFTDTLSPPDVPELTSWKPEGVALRFEGQARGELRMWVDPGFALLAAANMQGIEPDTEGAQEKGIDALKELLNIMVGNFITEMFGTRPVFDLGLPQRINLEKLATDTAHSQRFWLQAEGNPVLCVVEVAA
jgi:CheY-specific phosphatase CheX